ncbi:hypothetical protein ATO6_00865 [Oceanicola sp. 22II-s10i]|nr:hypothetical protein ATO6_00865 [Oceanicola sp. 22II-s10i]
MGRVATVSAPRPGPDPFSTEFTASALAVRQALTGFADWIAPLDLDEVETGAAELVLAEALNNVVEHAYRDAGAGPVMLHCSFGQGGLSVLIRDRGVPMPSMRVPLADLADGQRSPVDLREGGYGWFIIRDLARDIGYERRGAENTLTFRIAIGRTLWAG